MNSDWPFLVFMISFIVGLTLILVGFLVTFSDPQFGWTLIGIGLWLGIDCLAMWKLGNEK